MDKYIEQAPFYLWVAARKPEGSKDRAQLEELATNNLNAYDAVIERIVYGN